jgi:hypothetical protein
MELREGKEFAIVKVSMDGCAMAAGRTGPIDTTGKAKGACRFCRSLEIHCLLLAPFGGYCRSLKRVVFLDRHERNRSSKACLAWLFLDGATVAMGDGA